MSLVRIPPLILLLNLRIAILITLVYCVDAKYDCCQNYFCPTTSQIMMGSGMSFILDGSPTKQSDDHYYHYHQYQPNFYQRDSNQQQSEEIKPMTLPSCVITVFILFATLSKIGKVNFFLFFLFFNNLVLLFNKLSQMISSNIFVCSYPIKS